MAAEKKQLPARWPLLRAEHEWKARGLAALASALVVAKVRAGHTLHHRRRRSPRRRYPCSRRPAVSQYHVPIAVHGAPGCIGISESVAACSYASGWRRGGDGGGRYYYDRCHKAHNEAHQIQNGSVPDS